MVQTRFGRQYPWIKIINESSFSKKIAIKNQSGTRATNDVIVTMFCTENSISNKPLIELKKYLLKFTNIHKEWTL